MYKKIIIFFILSLALIGCSKEDKKEEIDIQIGNSSIFKEEDIGQVINYVKENFFIGAKILKIYYDEELSNKILSTEDLYKDIEKENKIVVFTDFYVEKEGDNPVFSKGTYNGYAWVFKRENNKSNWELINQGF